jgi:hypothetical protein
LGPAVTVVAWTEFFTWLGLTPSFCATSCLKPALLTFCSTT